MYNYVQYNSCTVTVTVQGFFSALDPPPWGQYYPPGKLSFHNAIHLIKSIYLRMRQVRFQSV